MSSSDPDRPTEDDGLFFVPEDHPRIVEPVTEPPVPDVPARRTSRRLGAADDPDRFDPSADAAAGGLPPEHPRGLDRAYDPDRYRPPGEGQSLKDLLGEGAHEGDRDNYQWAAGLVGVLLFLALVAFLFGNVLTP